jgi:iron(III) transport system substrate-binding protein
VNQRVLLAGASLLVAAPLLAGCGLLGDPDLVIYNAQHEELMTEIVPIFEEQTGLDVELRNGKDLELANQLVAEGGQSPADVFLTENSPAMSIVDNAGLFAPVSDEATAPIPDEYVPSSGSWTGILALENQHRGEIQRRRLSIQRRAKRCGDQSGQRPLQRVFCPQPSQWRIRRSVV